MTKREIEYMDCLLLSLTEQRRRLDETIKSVREVLKYERSTQTSMRCTELRERRKETMTYKYAVISDVNGASGRGLDIRIHTERRSAESQVRNFKDAGYQCFICQIDTLSKEYERCMRIMEGQPYG